MFVTFGGQCLDRFMAYELVCKTLKLDIRPGHFSTFLIFGWIWLNNGQDQKDNSLMIALKMGFPVQLNLKSLEYKDRNRWS